MYYYDISEPNSFCQIVASPQCLINIANNIGFKTAKLVDILEIPYEKTYPHFLPGTKIPITNKLIVIILPITL